MKLERLLFASIHGYLDPSNGAATASRDLLELLRARGIDCRVLSTGVLDYREETPLETVLEQLDVPVSRGRAPLAKGGTAPIFDFTLAGVRGFVCNGSHPPPTRRSGHASQHTGTQ